MALATWNSRSISKGSPGHYSTALLYSPLFCLLSRSDCPAVTFPLHLLTHTSPMFRFADYIHIYDTRMIHTRFAALRYNYCLSRNFRGISYSYPQPESSAGFWHGSGVPAGRAWTGSSVPPPQCRVTKKISTTRDGVSRKVTMKKPSQTRLARNTRRQKEKRRWHHYRRRCSRAQTRRWRWKGAIFSRNTVGLGFTIVYVLWCPCGRSVDACRVDNVPSVIYDIPWDLVPACQILLRHTQGYLVNE